MNEKTTTTTFGAPDNIPLEDDNTIAHIPTENTSPAMNAFDALATINASFSDEIQRILSLEMQHLTELQAKREMFFKTFARCTENVMQSLALMDRMVTSNMNELIDAEVKEIKQLANALVLLQRAIDSGTYYPTQAAEYLPLPDDPVQMGSTPSAPLEKVTTEVSLREDIRNHGVKIGDFAAQLEQVLNDLKDARDEQTTSTPVPPPSEGEQYELDA